jgi:hypothetical protein
MSALYVKNVPAVERAVRVVVSVSATVAALVLVPMPLSLGIAAATLGFMVTGLVGWCPACALVGRKLDASRG